MSCKQIHVHRLKLNGEVPWTFTCECLLSQPDESNIHLNSVVLLFSNEIIQKILQHCAYFALVQIT